LVKKAHSLIKYHHLYEEYENQVKQEAEEIGRIECEIDSLKQVSLHDSEIVIQSIDYIRNFKQEHIYSLLALPEDTKYLTLPFQAFFELGPKGTKGEEDYSWKSVQALIANRELLCKMMTDLFNLRIQDISRTEIERAEEFIRRFNKGFSRGDSSNLALSRAMVNFVVSCNSSCDILNSIQARNELAQTKMDKLEFMKKELAFYEKIVSSFEEGFQETMEQYNKAKGEFEDLSQESEEAKKVLKRFEDHYQAIAKERGSDKRNLEKIERLLVDLKLDRDELNWMKMKMYCNLPADTEMA